MVIILNSKCYLWTYIWSLRIFLMSWRLFCETLKPHLGHMWLKKNALIVGLPASDMQLGHLHSSSALMLWNATVCHHYSCEENKSQSAWWNLKHSSNHIEKRASCVYVFFFFFPFVSSMTNITATNMGARLLKCHWLLRKSAKSCHAK